MIEAIVFLLQALAALMTIFMVGNQLYTRRRLVGKNLFEWRRKLQAIVSSPRATQARLWFIFCGVSLNGAFAVVSLAALLSLDELPRTLVLYAIFFTASASYWFSQAVPAWRRI